VADKPWVSPQQRMRRSRERMGERSKEANVRSDTPEGKEALRNLATDAALLLSGGPMLRFGIKAVRIAGKNMYEWMGKLFSTLKKAEAAAKRPGTGAGAKAEVGVAARARAKAKAAAAAAARAKVAAAAKKPEFTLDIDPGLRAGARAPARAGVTAAAKAKKAKAAAAAGAKRPGAKAKKAKVAAAARARAKSEKTVATVKKDVAAAAALARAKKSRVNPWLIPPLAVASGGAGYMVGRGMGKEDKAATRPIVPSSRPGGGSKRPTPPPVIGRVRPRRRPDKAVGAGAAAAAAEAAAAAADRAKAKAAAAAAATAEDKGGIWERMFPDADIEYTYPGEKGEDDYDRDPFAIENSKGGRIRKPARKKSAKKSMNYARGGKVRGAGKARQGVRNAKMVVMKGS
jgi:hypothetical protein